MTQFAIFCIEHHREHRELVSTIEEYLTVTYTIEHKINCSVFDVVCVCVCARARVCVCVCVYANDILNNSTSLAHFAILCIENHVNLVSVPALPRVLNPKRMRLCVRTYTQIQEIDGW